jgi:hypothetical protein
MLALPWLKAVSHGLSLSLSLSLSAYSRFNPRPFMLDEVTLEHGFSLVLQYTLVTIIPLMFSTRSFIYHHPSAILASFNEHLEIVIFVCDCDA